MNSLHRYELLLAGSLAVGATLCAEGCKSTVENTVAKTRDELEGGKYFVEKGEKLEYVPYLKERVSSRAEKLPPLLSKVEAALTASSIRDTDVTIGFRQLEKDIEGIKTAANEGKLTIQEMETVWWALGQMENGFESAMRQDGLDILWLRDEQELRIKPAAQLIRGILERNSTQE